MHDVAAGAQSINRLLNAVKGGETSEWRWAVIIRTGGFSSGRCTHPNARAALGDAAERRWKCSINMIFMSDWYTYNECALLSVLGCVKILVSGISGNLLCAISLRRRQRQRQHRPAAAAASFRSVCAKVHA